MTQQRDNETPHFQRLATDYNRYRTLDKEPIEFLVDSIEGAEHAVCSIGCGTGRYVMALVEQMKSNGVEITRAVGVDPSQNMLDQASDISQDAGLDMDWIRGVSDDTNIDDSSMTLITAFNSVHYFPLEETLMEFQRIAKTSAHLAIYARVWEQELDHIWGVHFPDYADYSIQPKRDVVMNIPDLSSGVELVATEDFTFRRKTTFDWLIKQTRDKFYSTLGRYSDDEFEVAYDTFVNEVKSAYTDLGNIEYDSSYSLFLFSLTERDSQ
ncbi:MAG: class I SAM-dependent methyltransferase [Chloroflexi bacterium]|nr:class I SAM-dependent methyltransferase [Chloroflexota bacterium]